MNKSFISCSASLNIFESRFITIVTTDNTSCIKNRFNRVVLTSCIRVEHILKISPPKHEP